ncbi:MAG: MauE/DoxX family redox-associated membrane protein [Pseudomonadota bacterium]
MANSKTAVLYRMVKPEHTCVHGMKAKWLLERHGFTVEDNYLTNADEVAAFKAKHGVTTTPLGFINGEPIGGYSDLAAYFGKPTTSEGTSYRPVIVLFAMMALMAAAAAFVVTGAPISILSAEWFISFSMCGLAYLKLRDIESFSTMFLSYDLLARRWVPYGYVYPFAEGLAGVLMTAQVLHWVSIPIALLIGGIGAWSVFKAVYLDKRSLKCACVGGDSNVPLGFVSLTENLAMIAMALWMLAKPLI